MSNPQFREIEKLLESNDLRGAEDLCRNAILHNRNDVNMISILGAILLKSGRLDESEQQLRRAIKLAPEFAKPHDDLAGLCMHRKDFRQAESLFRRATELQPENGPSWFGLVHALKGQGDLAQARNVCGQVLVRRPEDMNAMRLMAVVLTEEGHLPEAGRLLHRIVDKAPENVGAALDLAHFHVEQHQFSQAIVLFRRAAELEPGNPDTHFSLAKVLSITGFSREALDAYDAGLALDPESYPGRSGRLHALRALGRSEDVIAGYRSCIQEGVNVGESWWSLSSLRTYAFSDEELDQMTTLRLSDGISEFDGAYLDFAIGKALDDRHRYDEAWQYYSSGNSARRETVYYDGVQLESEIDTIIESIDPAALQRAGKPVSQTVTPVFIIGMPRSGSTLIEQILASHSAVEATTELPYMIGLGKRYMVAGADNSAPAIVGLDADKLIEVGDLYLQASSLHRRASKPWFVDKMPDNFLYVGLISMVLPGAKIIEARRNSLDTCVGNYRQLFAKGKEFSYDLEELGDYYLQYRRIMQHWEKLLPEKVLTVDYEVLVENTEPEIRRILSHCELPWEDACLNFHETDRVVTTASSEQVRQPIYKSAVGFWKNYEKHLGDLIENIAPVLE
jgi:Flp pilus assembly protein TadD